MLTSDVFYPLSPRSVPPGRMQRLTELATALGTFLGLLAVAAMAGPNYPQKDTLSMLPVHHRQKRDWIWNQMHIDEEKNNSLPHYVGKVSLGLQSDGRVLEVTNIGPWPCSKAGDKCRRGCH